MSIGELLKNIDFKLVLIVLSIICLLIKKYEDYKKELSIEAELKNKKDDVEENVVSVQSKNVYNIHRTYKIIRVSMIIIASALLCYIFAFK